MQSRFNELHPDKILVSPGPGIPEDSNASLTVYKEFGTTTPILGVCLGHQAMGVVYGGKIVKAPVLMHGKTSFISHDNKTLFNKIPQKFEATRYHSLIVDRESLPGCLEISAETDDGVIMGIRHKAYPVEGIQFHPESILTKEGRNIINNWIAL